MDTTDFLVLMTSKDLKTIHHGLSSPVKPFTSPFIGLSVDEVTGWFEGNVTQPRAVGYFKKTFIVLEQEAVDEGICTVVSTTEDPAGRLHCDFTLALLTACTCEMHRSMEVNVMGSFKRSGMAMTKDNYEPEIALNGGKYWDGTEVQIDEDWRDFGNW